MTNFLAKLSALLIWLSGKKTYIICLCTIAGLWGSYLQGAVDLQNAMEGTVAALTGMSMRAAVAKSGPNPPQS
jgi:hypothetical protein